MNSNYALTESVCLAYSTFPSQTIAENVARELVESKIVACANLLPVQKSIYIWKDTLCEEPECLVLFKLVQANQEKLKERLPAIHPYENPCLVFLPIVDGLKPFLTWVAANSVS